MSTNPLNDISRIYLEQVASVEEGMTMKDFKQQRSRQKQKEKRAADKIAPGRRKDIHTDRLSPERAARHRANVDPDFEGNDEKNYPGGKLKNPKKIRKAKALGEIGESAVPGKPAERLGAVTAIPKSERDAARERVLAKAKAMRDKKAKRWWNDDGDDKGYEKGEVSGKFNRKKVEEANDGNLANNYPPYDKVTRGDVIAGRLGKDQMGGKKKKVTKEGYSNWREDLIEVVDRIKKDKDKDKEGEKITGENVDNTKRIKICPTMGEAVENLGGTLLEMVEVDEFDFIVESVYDELLDEGYDEDDIEEALEFALTEAKVTFGHDTPTMEKKRESLLSVAKRKLSGVKKAVKKAVAKGAGAIERSAGGVRRKLEAPPEGKYRGTGAGQKEKASSGSYTPSTQKKAEKPADPWEGSATTPPKEKKKKAAAPKAKTTKVSGGTAKAPARKRKSKLDDLLASVRSEEIQINEMPYQVMGSTDGKKEKKIGKPVKSKKYADARAAELEDTHKKTGGKYRSQYVENQEYIDEKTLTPAETKEKERIVKSMKPKLADFEKRYPGRGEEVLYATATELAKKIAK